MSNETRVRDAIERAQAIFAERPASARKENPSAIAVLGDGLRFEITGPAGERAVTDMPAPLGGEGTGSSPGWLLRASMASCTGTAIAMRAAALGISLNSLKVSVHSDSDARGLLGMGDTSAALSNLRMEVHIGAEGATAQQLEELVQWGEAHSPVSCTVRSNPPIRLEVRAD